MLKIILWKKFHKWGGRGQLVFIHLISDRYERLVDDLKGSGFNATMIALEIGCRGVVDLRNNANIEGVCNDVGIRAIKKLRGALGRLALIGSYRIWLARSSQQW